MEKNKSHFYGRPHVIKSQNLANVVELGGSEACEFHDTIFQSIISIYMLATEIK